MKITRKKILTSPKGVVKVKFNRSSKDEVKRLLVELVNSCKKSGKEKYNLQFLQQLGENPRFYIFLSEGDIVDKASMLTISVLFQITKKSLRS